MYPDRESKVAPLEAENIMLHSGKYLAIAIIDIGQKVMYGMLCIHRAVLELCRRVLWFAVDSLLLLVWAPSI